MNTQFALLTSNKRHCGQALTNSSLVKRCKITPSIFPCSPVQQSINLLHYIYQFIIFFHSNRQLKGATKSNKDVINTASLHNCRKSTTCKNISPHQKLSPSINEKDKLGKTPLHIACQCNTPLDIISLLLQNIQMQQKRKI